MGDGDLRKKTRRITMNAPIKVILKGEHKPIGTCPFCNKEVRASAGQAVTHYQNKPVHKKCRKANK